VAGCGDGCDSGGGSGGGGGGVVGVGDFKLRKF